MGANAHEPTAIDSATDAEPETACLCGIDEAGLGPILGPLVIAGTMLTGPRGRDPWKSLKQAVARSRPTASQFHVADSKKVNSGPHGFARLERTALGFWSTWRGSIPATVYEFLAGSGCDLEAFTACPWYEHLDRPLPIEADRKDLELRTHLLTQAMDDHGIRLPHMVVRPVEVVEYNRRIEETDNKSDTHFDVYGEVIADLLRRAPARTHAVADRCGGRMHYRHKLVALFPEARVHRVSETPSASAYRLLREDGTVRVTFAAGGEERAFPTALASCLAKYVRELIVRAMNNWFAERVPGLKHTAGYYVDGNRFLEDVDAVIEAEALDREALIRSR